MTFKLIVLVALAALALHLAWTGIVAPALAAGNSGAGGGDVHSLVGSKLGPSLGGPYHITGAKRGIASGAN